MYSSTQLPRHAIDRSWIDTTVAITRYGWYLIIFNITLHMHGTPCIKHSCCSKGLSTQTDNFIFVYLMSYRSLIGLDYRWPMDFTNCKYSSVWQLQYYICLPPVILAVLIYTYYSTCYQTLIVTFSKLSTVTWQ